MKLRNSQNPNVRRTSRVAVLLAAVALVAAGCSATSADPEETSGNSGPNELVYAVGYSPNSLNPATEFQHPVHWLSHEALIIQNVDGSLSPGLATEWAFSDGNKVFELTLRDDAKFSDGSAVDAAAVAAWLEYFAGANGPYSRALGVIDSIEAVDDLTVRITFPQPNPVAPLILANGALNWGAVSQIPSDPEELKTTTLGAGQYVLDTAATVSGDHWTYVPNEHYYDQSRINWDKVTVRLISNPTTALQALQAGDVQAISGGVAVAEAAQEDGFELVETKNSSITLYITDAGGLINPALGDVRVRQALNEAIDREALSALINGKYGEPVCQTPSFDGMLDDPADLCVPYDPEHAMELLDDAGYANGLEISVVSQDYSAPSNVTVIQAIAAYWEAIGITVTIVPSPTPADYATNMAGGNGLVQGSVAFDRSMFVQYNNYFVPGGSGHPQEWTVPEMDKLFNEAVIEEDPTPIYQDMTRLMAEDYYFVHLYVATAGPVFDPAEVTNVVASEKQSMLQLADWKPVD